MVHIHENINKIIIKFDYNREIIDIVKSVKAYWNPDEKYWYFTKNTIGYQKANQLIKKLEENYIETSTNIPKLAVDNTLIEDVESYDIYIERDENNRISISWNWSTHILDIFRETISEKRWYKKDKVWILPNTLKSKKEIVLFVEQLKDKYKIKNDIDIRDIEKQVEKELNDSFMEVSNIDVPSPKYLNYFGYQKAGIEYITRKLKSGKGGVLLADEMGLGKSISIAGYMNLNNKTIKKILILCPNSLKFNWEKELKKWLVEKKEISVIDGKNKNIKNITIANYEAIIETKVKKGITEKSSLFQDIYNFGFDLLVMDECHYLQNQTSKRTKSAKKLSQNIDKKIGLTGTPIRNYPKNLFAILNILRPDIYSNWFSYAKTYCNAHKTNFGWDFNGSSNIDDLWESLRTNLMIRRMSTDVMKELPEITRTFIQIGGTLTKTYKDIMSKFKEAFKIKEDRKKLLTTKETKEYKKLVKDNIKDGRFDELHQKFLAKKQLDAILDTNKSIKFEMIQQLRQEAFDIKKKDVVELIQNTVDSKGSCVVFTYTKKAYNDIKKDLEVKKYKVIGFTGETSPSERQKIVDDFQSGKADVFICTIGAGAEGITLTRANTCIITQMDWVPSTLAQAEKRIHRIGQKNHVDILYPVLKDSIEVHIANIIEKKLNIITNVLDKQGLNDNIDVNIFDELSKISDFI